MTAPGGEWVMVPREPTDGMLEAALRLQGDDAFAAKAPALLSALLKIYRAMLAAAQSPPAPVGLPELPFSPYMISEWAGPEMTDRTTWTAYTADQLRAYGEACRAAAPAVEPVAWRDLATCPRNETVLFDDLAGHVWVGHYDERGAYWGQWHPKRWCPIPEYTCTFDVPLAPAPAAAPSEPEVSEVMVERALTARVTLDDFTLADLIDTCSGVYDARSIVRAALTAALQEKARG